MKELVTQFLIIFVFLPLLLTLSILSAILRPFVTVLAKIFRHDFSHIFSGLGLLYSTEYIHRRPKVSIMVHTILDGPLQLDYVRRQFEQRILNRCDAEGNFEYRQLRQTWTQFCGFVFWKWDRKFRLSQHVRLYDYTEPELALPSPCTEDDLRRATGSLITVPYAENKSPWELLLIPDYQYVDVQGQRFSGSVLTLRIHHSLADGFSVFQLLKQLFHAQTEALSANFPQLSPLQKIMQIAIQVLKFPTDVAKIMRRNQDEPNCWHLTGKKLTRRYISFLSDRIPVSTIKAIRHKHSVGYNTVVYAITVGAICRQMRQAGQKVPESIKCFTPFPMPDHPGGLVNHW